MECQQQPTRKKIMSYLFHCDPGHGWMAVKVTELNKLGLIDKISKYSYLKGKTAYLEEDCDAPLFLKAKEEAGEKIESSEIRTIHKNETSRIRNYYSFTPALAKEILNRS